MNTSLRHGLRLTASSLLFGALLLSAPAMANQSGKRLAAVSGGVTRTTAQLMAQPQESPAAVSQARTIWELEQPDRSTLPQNPDAPAVSSTADGGVARPAEPDAVGPTLPQVNDLAFTGATLTDTGAFPPDNMGAVGPSQFVVFVNGRLRTFNKSTGAADGVLNANPDVFFAPVMTPVVSPVLINFTSDPQVRYDRLSGRWILTIIDVPCVTSTCSTLAPNRQLIAVSDAASNGVITPSTVWTFYYFQADAVNFLDYPSLGVDSKALYIGGDMFSPAGSFVGCNAYVVRKTSVLSGGPIVVTAFANVVLGAGEGPFAPRGVDNVDPTSNEGYFIGVSNSVYSRLDIIRVSDPGGTPTISPTLLLTVPTTTSPNPMTHLGNTGGNNGRVDALDDRIFAAVIRNGRLWTAHNFRVSTTGVANTGTTSRNGVRWYELNGVRSTDNAGVPVVVQSGTLFDNASTLAAARQYIIPSVGISGQGHVAMGVSTAGTPNRLDVGAVGRLSGDALGTMRAMTLLSASATAYNPPSDPGGAGGRRWGDYSFTSLDPLDDMTMWTINEFCDATNSYGCRVARLRAPQPATPQPLPTVITGIPSITLTLSGVSVSGTGFYDPGADLPGVPAFNHIQAQFTNTGVTGTPPTVLGVTYVNPTTLQVTFSTTTASPNLIGEQYGIKVTNPDGQSVEVPNIIEVDTPPVPTLLAMFTADPTEAGIELRWQFSSQSAYTNVAVERSDAQGIEWSAVSVERREEGEVTIALDRTAEAGKTYQYRLRVQGANGQSQTLGPIVGSANGLAGRFTLDRVAPNPSSGSVQVAFSVGRTSPVKVSVLDIQGREVAVLVDGVRTAGQYVESWNGTVNHGKASAGIYFVRYRADGHEGFRRLTITH